MTDQAPTTDEVRAAWFSRRTGLMLSAVSRIKDGPNTGFDRWLDLQDREVAAKALEEAADDVFDTAMDTEVADWLRARAWRIRNGEL